jgi:nitrous oxide reductase accessory protein NosL
MLHTVEIGSFCGDVIAAMSNMMRWLDARGSQPVIFQQIPGDVTAFLLGFISEGEALAFVCAFGGRLTRSETKGPAI